MAPVGGKIDLELGTPTAPQARLVFDVVATKRYAPAASKSIALRLKTTRASTVTATLLDPKGKRAYRWRFLAKAGITIKRLTMPPSVTKPGRYRLVFSVQSGRETVKKSIVVQIVKKTKKPVRPKKPLQIVLASTGNNGKEIERGLSKGIEVVPAAVGEDTWTLTGASNKNVEVIVVDVDRYGLQLIRDLRLVFPTVRIIGLTNDPRRLAQAVRAGATIAVPRSTPPKDLAKLIQRLANRRAVLGNRLAQRGLDRERDGDQEQRDPDQAAQQLLREPAGDPRAEPGSRECAREADREQIPLDLELRRVRGERGDAEREADDEVRPDRLVRAQADRAEERRHPQRAEDDPDRTADEADRETEEPCRPEARFRARASADGPHQQVDAVPREHGGDRREEQPLRHARPDERAHDRADHGRRRHPGDDAPVDAALARVTPTARCRGRSADRDVRPRGRSRVARGDQDRGQPERPEHESDCRSEVPRRERRGEGQRELPGFQSGSLRSATAFAARARMKSRSERRFR